MQRLMDRYAAHFHDQATEPEKLKRLLIIDPANAINEIPITI